MNILVIEDTQKHIDDAKAFFSSLENKELKVVYVKTYEKAREYFGKVDGVISDIFFPLSSDHTWNQPEPIGVRVAIELSQKDMPFVLNTAGYHHGRKYQWIFELSRDQGWALSDSGHDYENESEEKNWRETFNYLMCRMGKPELAVYLKKAVNDHDGPSLPEEGA